MARRDLSKEERETIVLTSEADETYDIFTFNADLKKKLKKYSVKYPELCRIIEEDGKYGFMRVIIRKTQLSIRLLEPISDQRRKEVKNQAIENGLRNQKRS